MKKLLTILGAMSLTASTSLVVVSCSNNDSKSIYKEFKSLADATRPEFDDQGEVTKKGSTLIYYIGAKDNYSSLSFEYAMKKSTGANSLQEAFDLINNGDENSNNEFIKSFKRIGELIKAGNTTGSATSPSNYSETKTEYSKKKDLWYQTSWKMENQLFQGESTSAEIKIAGTTINEVSDLWADKTSTKKILDDWITPSISRMVYSKAGNESYDKNKTQDKQIINELNEQIKNRKNVLKSAKGPLFLVVRNGEFGGYFEGFESYSDISENVKNTPKNPIKFEKNEFEKNIIDWFKVSALANDHSNSLIANLYDNVSNTNYKIADSIWKSYDNWQSIESDSSSETTDPGEPTDPEGESTFSYKSVTRY